MVQLLEAEKTGKVAEDDMDTMVKDEQDMEEWKSKKGYKERMTGRADVCRTGASDHYIREDAPHRKDKKNKN
eukprot:8565106-Ditylum_brightwellii.AAC.1